MTERDAGAATRAEGGRRSPALRDAPRLLWAVLDKFFAQGSPGMAAALSFFTFFSLPALLSLLLSLIGAVTDPLEVERAITTQMESLMGAAGSEQVRTVIQHSRQSEMQPTVRAAISGVLLLLGATTAFASLQNSLNRAWNVKPDPRRGNVRNFLMKRVFSFGVMLTVGFMLLVSLSLTATLTAVGTRLTAGLGVPEAVLRVVDVVLSFALVTLLFAAMFKLLPDAKIAWRDVVVGAICTAVFFVLGKIAIGYYLGRSDPGSAYGAAGSLAIVMIWVYYTSMIVLFGAMFTRVWAEWYGRGVHPEKGAVEFAEIEKRVEEG